MSEETKPVDSNSALALLDVRQHFKCEDVVDKIVETVKSGRVNPLEAMTVMKRFEKISKTVLEDKTLNLKDLALVEAEKHLSGSKKSFELYSSTITRGATYTFYDFGECNDPVLAELYKIEIQLKAFIKDREEKLKDLDKEDNSKTEQDLNSLGLGIKSTSKEETFPEIPALVWQPYGEICVVKAPRKVQKMGLKFAKI